MPLSVMASAASQHIENNNTVPPQEEDWPMTMRWMAMVVVEVVVRVAARALVGATGLGLGLVCDL